MFIQNVRLFLLAVVVGPLSVPAQEKDFFAGMAEQQAKLLAAPPPAMEVTPPPVMPSQPLPAMEAGRKYAFQPQSKLETAAQLQAELARMRAQFAPFLANLAPPVTATRISQPLDTFQWRLGIAQDNAQFDQVLAGKSGQWQPVKIPHYGPPIGAATAYYRTPFTVTPELRKPGTLWLCFRGVDYFAKVYLNGNCVGTHEGFFAPFEFDITDVVRDGENILLVQVDNDTPSVRIPIFGEKIYAATGIGWDEPVVGWHHCPAGMGVFQPVRIEARPPVFIEGIYVRPLPEKKAAEVWVDVYGSRKGQLHDIDFRLSLFGQNFKATLFEGREFKVEKAGPNRSTYKLDIPVDLLRLWEFSEPWLYQLQVELHVAATELVDVHSGKTTLPVTAVDKTEFVDRATRTFGMRQFSLDTDGEPKGRFVFNGREIRLRGANTMGFEQLDVMRGDFKQLIDDILLAKIANMNFLRITQRPVQEEVYDYCDRLGLMVQTDLPHFARVRRTLFLESVKQSADMARLLRAHPCQSVYTLINESSTIKNAADRDHRNLNEQEMESMFRACSEAIRYEDPDAVIKPIDGGQALSGLPDTHIYLMWYQFSYIEKEYRGYGMAVKKGWNYGVGEYGAEGLDTVDLMRRRYPASWLPVDAAQDKKWEPWQIPDSQSGRRLLQFRDKPVGLEGWVRESRDHQRFATQLITDSLRRNNRVVSSAIHLFIDAWPSGWLKSIMDCERGPKPAFFAYREALTPLMVNLRSDRLTCWAGAPMQTEAWICNDTSTTATNWMLHYEVECGGQILASGAGPAEFTACHSDPQGYLPWTAPLVTERKKVTLRLALVRPDGGIQHDTSFDFEVFPRPPEITTAVEVVGSADGQAARLAKAMSLPTAAAGANVVLVDGLALTDNECARLLDRANGGATVILLGVSPTVKVNDCFSFGKVVATDATIYWCSTIKKHPWLAGFQPNDFKYWYDESVDMIGPIAKLKLDANKEWNKVLGPVVIERPYGKGRLVVSVLSDLAVRVRTNPVAWLFVERLFGIDAGTLSHP